MGNSSGGLDHPRPAPFRGADQARLGPDCGKATKPPAVSVQFVVQPFHRIRLVKDGRLRLLAAATSRRSPLVPDAPTIAETAYPGYALDIWLGVSMPATVPQSIVNKVAADIIKVLSAPEVKARLAPQGVEVVTSSPQAMAKLVREDHARWGKIVKAAGIKGD